MCYFIRLLGFVACLGWFIPNYSHAKPMKHANKQLIVLLNGLCDKVSTFDTVKQKLEKAFPSASIIALTSTEGMLSVMLSIKEQAKAAFQELTDKVNDIQSKSIVLIGHSQGGLRAYALLKQYETLLNIKGLITLATPWEGAHGTKVDGSMLKQHLTKAVLNDLRMLALNLGYPSDMLINQLNITIQKNQELLFLPGAKDLKMDSLFLDEIKKTLLHEKVPIWAIGGIQNDFGALLPRKIKHRFIALNSMYTFFIVGQDALNTAYHDMKIPLASQHARNFVPQSKKNFKRIKIRNVFHSTHVWPKLNVPVGKYMLSHPDALRKIITCAKEAFSQK
ncbi:esterase/lipase family protein [Candidatus Cardinium hertigii]|uniref:DUF676 domain-containing protein n=1 Tax=Candidatus Cardinium hertigii TaxID=247481 RepID=A0A2Z3L7X8_9BACT|nr:hypothetical protein [Candidatus Cardinium hertigii]AWN81539.1 hypothetical protein DK880_00206 [Candidatus Cardinium hertigii]